MLGIFCIDAIIVAVVLAVFKKYGKEIEVIKGMVGRS
jgi:hypothetical protein